MANISSIYVQSKVGQRVVNRDRVEEPIGELIAIFICKIILIFYKLHGHSSLAITVVPRSMVFRDWVRQKALYPDGLNSDPGAADVRAGTGPRECFALLK
jgi:hypothetical protein